MELVEEIEEEWAENHTVETDKAWDAIHRCLTDGTLAYDNGSHPLNKVVLGGKQLYHGDDYIVSYIKSDEVKDVAEALAPLDKSWLRAKYSKIDMSDYGPLSDEDFDYTWENLEDLKGFFQRAGQDDRSVIFTASQ
jgi:hypothetical protein